MHITCPVNLHIDVMISVSPCNPRVGRRSDVRFDGVYGTSLFLTDPAAALCRHAPGETKPHRLNLVAAFQLGLTRAAWSRRPPFAIALMS